MKNYFIIWYRAGWRLRLVLLVVFLFVGNSLEAPGKMTAWNRDEGEG